MHIKLWISPATYEGIDSENNIYFLNGNYLKAGGLAVAELINETLAPGDHLVRWRGEDFDNNLVPNGFYRVYIQAKDVLLWKDILIITDYDHLSIDLLTLLSSFGMNN